MSPDRLDSERAAEAMRQPGAYPHAPERVETVETHISRVFLTGRFAYKTKKPVDLGFLDFTTLEARRAFCEEEVRLNRRTAEGIYLGVVPVTANGAVEVGGAGRIVDYAVKMTQFPQEALFDHMAREGSLERGHIDSLADVVARFHAAAAPADPQSRFGTGERVLAAALDALDGAGELRQWTLREHRRVEPAFAARRLAKRVRECHGDMHLGNVAWLNGRAVPFDCIEFSEELRWIDVMSDVAFLTMDLAGLSPALGHRFLDRYLGITGDYEGLDVLRFYEVYRAAVRAKVSRLRESQCPAGSRAAADAQVEYRRRLALALQLSRAGRPALILMHGLSGSGKTTVSQAVVERFGAVRLRSDVERKRLHGLDALAPSGGSIYGADASARTYARLGELAHRVLDAGRIAVVDAAFLERGRRDAFRAIARAAGVPFAIVHCEASEDELRGRVRQRELAGSDASEAGIAVLERQIATQQALAEDEAEHVVTLRDHQAIAAGFPAGDRLAALID